MCKVVVDVLFKWSALQKQKEKAQLLEDEQFLYIMVAHKTKQRKACMESLSTETFVENYLVAISPSALSSLEQPLVVAKCPMISQSNESNSIASRNTSALHKFPLLARVNYNDVHAIRFTQFHSTPLNTTCINKLESQFLKHL
jgi:hypothetical protein